jgi:hypothetical protein
MVNTPPTYNWYLLGLVLEWLKEQGGLAAIDARNIRKANRLYEAIDASAFYSNPVALSVRSRMNVPFRLADAALEQQFSHFCIVIKRNLRDGFFRTSGAGAEARGLELHLGGDAGLIQILLQHRQLIGESSIGTVDLGDLGQFGEV